MAQDLLNLTIQVCQGLSKDWTLLQYMLESPQTISTYTIDVKEWERATVFSIRLLAINAKGQAVTKPLAIVSHCIVTVYSFCLYLKHGV